MVAALHDVGIDRVTGYEVSEVQVQMARTMRPEASMVLHRLEDVYQIAGSVDADVVSMIGVLEHLQKPIEILQALGDNQAARYVFISVPLFSLSVFVELAFPDVMQRRSSRLILISTRINR